MSTKRIYDWRDGIVMDWTATAAKTSGDLVRVNTYIGVAMITGVTGDVIPLDGWGVHTLTKPTGVSFAQGAEVYLTAAGALTGTDTSNYYVGKAWAAATSGAGQTTVRVGLAGPGVNALTI